MDGFSLRHLPKTGQKTTELACGTSIQSFAFLKLEDDVTGLDLSADMLKIAEKRAIHPSKIDLWKAICWTCQEQVNTTLSRVTRTQSVMQDEWK